MDFALSPQEEAFRQELSDWLDENMKEMPEWYGKRDMLGPEMDSDEYYAFSFLCHQSLKA